MSAPGQAALERKERREARTRLRLAGMYPTSDKAQMAKLALIHEIQALKFKPVEKVTINTRWG